MDLSFKHFATIDVNNSVLEAHYTEDVFLLESNKGVVWAFTFEQLVDELEMLIAVEKEFFKEKHQYVYSATDDLGSIQVVGVFNKEELQDWIEMCFIVMFLMINID